MNWDAIGAIGEILGALAVVISLVYLAIQIRISNRASKQAAMREIQDLNSQFLTSLGASTDNARIWLKGGLDHQDLSDYEKFQYRIYLFQTTQSWERLHRAWLSGEIEDWIYNASLKSWRAVMASPGFKSWFHDVRDRFNPDWSSFLESEMANLTAPYNPQGLNIENRESGT